MADIQNETKKWLLWELLGRWFLPDDSWISTISTLYIPGRKLWSAESLLLCPPKCRTVTYGSKSFLGISCTFWNSLPKNLRETRSLFCFKSSLKTHLSKKNSCPNFLLFWHFILCTICFVHLLCELHWCTALQSTQLDKALFKFCNNNNNNINNNNNRLTWTPHITKYLCKYFAIST